MDNLSKRILAQAQDYMCYPQLGHDPFREENETYAQSLRGYIEFVLESSDNLVDPMDPTVIY